MRAVAPEPTATMAITAATPMIMPSMVKAERMRFTFRARSAIRLLARTLFIRYPLHLLHGHQLEILCRIARLGKPFVKLESSVLKVDISAAVLCDFGVVRHED